MASVESAVKGSMGSDWSRKSWGQPVSSKLVGTRHILFLGKTNGGIGDIRFRFDPEELSVLTRRCKLSMSNTKAGVGRSLSSNPSERVTVNGNSDSAKFVRMIDFMICVALFCSVLLFAMYEYVQGVIDRNVLVLEQSCESSLYRKLIYGSRLDLVYRYD